jgi:hypothetical protein
MTNGVSLQATNTVSERAVPTISDHSPRRTVRSGRWISRLCFTIASIGVLASAVRLPSVADSADLYVLRSGSTQAQPCEVRATADQAADASAITALVRSKLGSYTIQQGSAPGPDFLQPYLNPASGAAAAPNVILATYCKSADVYTISILGYAVKNKIVSTGSVSGTFDALETADWSNLFAAASVTFVVPNVSFLPVANDTTNVVNARLMHNLPVTPIQTPAPAPTATPASGTPAIPTTRLAQCQASAYRMLISGRTLLTSASNDLSRAAVVGATLKQSAPDPWGTYYTILGTVVGGLYTPNSAEVGADVFICPPDKPDKLYMIGGLDHHITGHSTTPALGTNPMAAQRAVDLATTDLQNQLFCIIQHEIAEMNLPGVSLDKPSAAFSAWCDGKEGYYARLGVPALVTQPVDSLFPLRLGRTLPP